MSSIRIERIYPHPPEKVWRALTESDLLSQWLMPNDFQARFGHRFTFRTDPGPGFDGIVHCEVRELVPCQRMVWSWRGGPIDTVVTFELTAVAAGTRLRVRQTGFRGVRGNLVRLILALGARTLYGRRLPEVLAGLEPAPGAAACMARSQSQLERLLAFITPTRRSHDHNPTPS